MNRENTKYLKLPLGLGWVFGNYSQWLSYFCGMKKWAERIRAKLKYYFDRSYNDKLKKSVLQAIPFWVGSVITGILAVFYAKAFHWAEDFLKMILGIHPLLIFILTPVCFVASWWLIKRFSPYAKGSGIPQVMASIDLATPANGKKVHRLLNIKVLIIKILSSMLMVMGGGIIGREGPTIQIAGSVFTTINKYLPKWWVKISERNMIMTGAAAGLSAAFNTPLGGIVFAIEELAKTHIKYFKTALFTAVIIAGLTSQTLAGSYLYLGYPKTQNITLFVMLPVILVSGISGLLASQFSIYILKLSRWKEEKLKSTRSNILFLILSALVIASISYFLSSDILGSGKGLIEDVLFSEQKQKAWYTPFIRMIGCALSFTSGAAGGIFAPALSIGASIGAVFSDLIHLSPAETNVVILSGMVAFLTGITRAPFTSAIIVLEMTDRHSLIFHLMLAGIISSVVSLLISRHSLYEYIKMGFIKKAISNKQ